MREEEGEWRKKEIDKQPARFPTPILISLEQL